MTIATGQPILASDVLQAVSNASASALVAQGSAASAASSISAAAVQVGLAASQATLAAAYASQAAAAGALGVGPFTASGGTLARTIPAHFGDFANVADFVGGVGDGTTDATSAIHTACGTGARYVLFPRGNYSAPSLNDVTCRDTIFIGDGAALVNLPATSRKFIASFGSGGPVIPSYTHISAKNTPSNGRPAVTVMFIGDSHTTWDAHDVFTSPGLCRKIANAFMAANPGTAYTFLNYGIGGTNLANLNMIQNSGASGWVPSSYPDWWTNHSLTWLQTCQAQNPDIVVWIRCTNEVNISPGLEVSNALAALTTMSGWPKVPNHIFCIEPARSLRQMPTPNTEESYAMFLRTFAMNFGMGVLDMARMGCMVRDGFDPLRGQSYVIANTNASPAKSLPYTWPGQTRDYGVLVDDFGSAGAAAFGYAGGEFQFSTSGVSGDVFAVGIDSGTGHFYYRATTAGVTTISRTVTSVPAVIPAGGTISMVFQLSGTNVVVALDGVPTTTLIYSGPVMRFGGPFTPVMNCTASGQSAFCQWSSMSTPVLNVPTLTDTEFWGISTPDYTHNYFGGDSDVHPSSRVVAIVYDAVIGAQVWSAPGDATGVTRASAVKSFSDYNQLVGQSGAVAIQTNTVAGSDQFLYVAANSSGLPVSLQAQAPGTEIVNIQLVPHGAGKVLLSGPTQTTGGLGVFGQAAPTSQPAAPVTLADVIAIIRGCGLSA